MTTVEFNHFERQQRANTWLIEQGQGHVEGSSLLALAHYKIPFQYRLGAIEGACVMVVAFEPQLASLIEVRQVTGGDPAASAFEAMWPLVQAIHEKVTMEVQLPSSEDQMHNIQKVDILAFRWPKDFYYDKMQKRMVIPEDLPLYNPPLAAVVPYDIGEDDLKTELATPLAVFEKLDVAPAFPSFPLPNLGDLNTHEMPSVDEISRREAARDARTEALYSASDKKIVHFWFNAKGAILRFHVDGTWSFSENGDEAESSQNLSPEQQAQALGQFGHSGKTVGNVQLTGDFNPQDTPDIEKFMRSVQEFAQQATQRSVLGYPPSYHPGAPLHAYPTWQPPRVGDGYFNDPNQWPRAAAARGVWGQQMVLPRETLRRQGFDLLVSKFMSPEPSEQVKRRYSLLSEDDHNAWQLQYLKPLFNGSQDYMIIGRLTNGAVSVHLFVDGKPSDFGTAQNVAREISSLAAKLISAIRLNLLNAPESTFVKLTVYLQQKLQAVHEEWAIIAIQKTLEMHGVTPYKEIHFAVDSEAFPET